MEADQALTSRGRVALVVAAIAATSCSMKPSEDERRARRESCAKRSGYDDRASADALSKVGQGACRSTLYWTKCDPWWDRVVTVCAFDGGADARRFEVHTNLSLDTTASRRDRSAMCDALRYRVSMSAPATIHDTAGRAFTTCGRPRGR